MYVESNGPSKILWLFFLFVERKKYCGCTIDTLHKEPDLNQQELYCVMTEELIDNNIRRRGGMRRSQNDPQNMRSASHDMMNLIPELRATRSKKDTKIVPWKSSVSRGDVECFIKAVLQLFVRL